MFFVRGTLVKNLTKVEEFMSIKLGFLSFLYIYL